MYAKANVKLTASITVTMSLRQAELLRAITKNPFNAQPEDEETKELRSELFHSLTDQIGLVKTVVQNSLEVYSV